MDFIAIELHLENLNQNESAALQAIKVMATVGRMLPRLFINYADEYSEFILNKLLKEDFARYKPTCGPVAMNAYALIFCYSFVFAVYHFTRSTRWPFADCRGGPLQLTADKAGEEWGRPSPGIALKAAALKVNLLKFNGHKQYIYLSYQFDLMSGSHMHSRTIFDLYYISCL